MSDTPVATALQVAADTSAAHIASEVADVLELVFDAVEALRAETQAVFTGRDGRGPAECDFGVLRATATAQLRARSGLIVGAGYVAAPGVVADHQYFLEWWSTSGAAPPARLEVDLDPCSDLFRDYTRLPWFAVPRDTARRHVTGPYVDYLCTDEYTLTFTSPVYDCGRFLGVTGADVFVSRFESLILPRLRQLPAPATLVNVDGRVLVSNSARMATGSLVRHLDVRALWAIGEASSPRGPVTLHRCGDFPIGLLLH